MEDLIDFVSQKADIPVPEAKVVTAVTLDFLMPHFSPLLKNTVEVLLQYPDLSEAEKDLLVATRILFPINNRSPEDTPPQND